KFNDEVNNEYQRTGNLLKMSDKWDSFVGTITAKLQASTDSHDQELLKALQAQKQQVDTQATDLTNDFFGTMRSWGEYDFDSNGHPHDSLIRNRFVDSHPTLKQLSQEDQMLLSEALSQSYYQPHGASHGNFDNVKRVFRSHLADGL